MEHLVLVFNALIEQTPADPMAPEWVVVQSRGMRQWITREVARLSGICANMRFVFPRQLIDHFLGSNADPSNQAVSIDKPFLFWRVLKHLMDDDRDPALPMLDAYLAGDARGLRKIGLASKIADCFDDYLVYRPQMLTGWQKGDSKNSSDPDVQWQSSLWQEIINGKQTQHLAYLTHLFLSSSLSQNADSSALPKRISLFGISTLPQVFLKILEKISKQVDVHIFLQVPSPDYFFDAPSKRQLLSTGPEAMPESHEMLLMYEQIHPLLSSLGTSQTVFLSQLEQYHYHEPFPDMFEDPMGENPKMLSVIQSDIFNLVCRRPGLENGPITVHADDDSIQIHSCHSPLREAQVLKDQLLHTFKKDPTLSPHDIIVMMPDIEAYTPAIESVFSMDNPLPFVISDRRRRVESEFLETFLAILSLPGSRLTHQQIRDLMYHEPIMAHFGFSKEDLPILEEIIENAGILWGKDDHHREQLGIPGYVENTWQFGFDRLFVGMAMPPGHEDLVNGVLPCESFEGHDLKLLGRFARFCSIIFDFYDTTRAAKKISQWCRILTRLSEDLLGSENITDGDHIFLYQSIDDLKIQAHKAGFSSNVSFEVMAQLVERQLDQTVSQGNFLAGKITFCNIMPMRSIPYRIIALMGMNEAAFPRQVFRPGFDLIRKFPKAGDRSVRHEDRHLFLETFLSARQKFIITYTGLDIRDNSPIPACGPVNELMDTIADSFSFSKDTACYHTHFLHPFDSRYFIPGSGFSYSQINYKIADALKDTPQGEYQFVDTVRADTPDEWDGHILMDEFIAFFRNPCAYFVRHCLGIEFPRLVEDARDREPFSLMGLDQFRLGEWLLEKRVAGNEDTDVYPIMKAAGLLPYGEKGRDEYQRVQGIGDILIDAAGPKNIEKKIESPQVTVVINRVCITVNPRDLYPGALNVLTFGKLNGTRLLTYWLRHLFLNLREPAEKPLETRVIGQDPAGRKPVLKVVFKPLKKNEADRILSELMNLYLAGRNAPLCFFCRTGFEFAKALAGNGFEPDQNGLKTAMKKSRNTWAGSMFMTGESQDRHIDLCFSGIDLFRDLEMLETTGFINNITTVFKPMLAYLEEEK